MNERFPKMYITDEQGNTHPKFMNVAFVEQSGRNFLFEVPGGHNVSDGTKVLCDTRYGRQEGIIRGGNFRVDYNDLKCLVKAVGAKLPLRKIVGRYHFEELN